MSLDQFLENPYGHESRGQQKPVIAMASVWPAWEVSMGGDRLYHCYEADQTGENEAKAKQEAESVAPHGAYINLGLVTIIYAEDAIQSNFTDDWYSFVPVYHSKSSFYITARGEETLRDSGHLENVQALISNGPFPYDIIIEHLRENPEVFENKMWCRLVQQDEPVLKAKGVTNKAGYPIQFFVVEKSYKSREEALADSNEQNSQAPINASVGGALSEKAIKNNWTLAGLQEDAGTIHKEIAELASKLGEGPEALPAKKAMKEAKKLTAINWAVESEDFDLLDYDLPF